MRIVILNGVVKATQTGIPSSQALVLMGPLTKVGPYRPHGLHPIPTTWFTVAVDSKTLFVKE